MDTDQLVSYYPQLFHVSDARSWPPITQLGLLSASALLDRFEIEAGQRLVLERQRRTRCETLEHPLYGTAILRDQKRLNLTNLEACLSPDMSIAEWLCLLNRRVHFWVTKTRLAKFLGANEYRSDQQLVLVLDTASVVAAHEREIGLAPINTGDTRSRKPERGRDTVVPIAAYPFERWRLKRKTYVEAVVELSVDYAVPDLVDHVERAEIVRPGQKSLVLYDRR
jgi:hypothetical protein